MQRNAVISDTHGGHRFGLLYPGIKLTTLEKIESEEGTDERLAYRNQNYFRPKMK